MASYSCRARHRWSGWLSFEGGEQASPVQQPGRVYTKDGGKNTRENALPTAATATVKILQGKFGCLCGFCYWSICRSLFDPATTLRVSSRATVAAR